MWFFDIWSFFLKNLPRKLKFLFKPDKYNGHFTFTIISRSVLLRMRNVSDRICREKTHGWIFVKCGYFYFCSFFSKTLPRKLKFLFKPDKHNGHFTFTIKSRSVRLRIRNVSDRSCREKNMDGFSWNVVFYFWSFLKKSAQKIEVSF